MTYATVSATRAGHTVTVGKLVERSGEKATVKYCGRHVTGYYLGQHERQ